ncbi:WD40/YVTN/BNR-like repeat-containing protein [Bacillus infantis]|uniref:Exo-alpha-sialidase n=1 Tax=Bacillus infantis TaxID=324767 RepID=A0A5D4R5W7_9BACI|nr:hypothetical protein [Bacillus infantis]TYS46765.1 hypothetical protein FZD51_14935 [Bacillus infantis]
MPLKKQGTFPFNHTDQQDDLYRVKDSIQIKKDFDSRGEELKKTVNTLIDDLGKTTSGDSGAKNIGVSTIEGIAGSDVQTVLQKLKEKDDAASTHLTGLDQSVGQLQRDKADIDYVENLHNGMIDTTQDIQTDINGLTSRLSTVEQKKVQLDEHGFLSSDILYDNPNGRTMNEAMDSLYDVEYAINSTGGIKDQIAGMKNDFSTVKNEALSAAEEAQTQATFAKEQGEVTKQRLEDLNGLSAVQFKDRQDAFDELLAENAQYSGEKINNLQTSLPRLGVPSVLPPSKHRVLAPLSENACNYVGQNGIITGSPTYEDVLFYKGMKFDAGQLLEIPVAESSSLKSGTVFMRFKTLQKFDDSLNMEYKLFNLYDSNGSTAVSAQLHYLDAQGYNGVEVIIRNGSDLKRLTVNNLEFENDTVYSMAVTWNYDGNGDGNISFYIDGLIERSTTFSSIYVPIDADKILIGNQTALNRPAQCVIESVFITFDKLDTSGILKLHRSPINMETIFNSSVYKQRFNVVGYKRELQGTVVLNYHKGILYGINGSVRNKLLISSDEGKTWTEYYDFTTGYRIYSVDFVGSDIYVGVEEEATDIFELRKGSIDSPVFTEVLTFNKGFLMANGYNFDSYNGNIVVSEYGSGDGVNLARVFLSTDGGNSFNVIKTLPPDSRHVHSSKFDPFTGYLWITWGDNIEGTEYSPDMGVTWIMVTDKSYHQNMPIAFTENAVLLGSDTITGGTHIRIYEKNKQTIRMLSNPTSKYLQNVYAINTDSSGYLWWFGHKEYQTNVSSALFISPDFGSTPLLLEDIGDELIDSPYKFIETKDFIYLGNSKITKPIIKEV